MLASTSCSLREGKSRFPSGMTNKKQATATATANTTATATANTKATATATANTGVLRFAQDDGENL